MKFVRVAGLLFLSLSLPAIAFSQQKKSTTLERPLQLVRTTTRHESLRFGYGGSLTIIGAPEGSITIEAWPQSEVDVSAEIQLRADTEADLNLLAAVNTFVLDEDLNHIRIMSTGTHDKAFMKTVAKKFPKTLLGLPWKIDYRIRVPLSIDIEINAGRGPINITGVEGNIRMSATESETNLKLSGGTVSVTVAVGKVNLIVPSKSWRGVGAEIRLALGELTLELPPGFSGDIDADVLRFGRIEDKYGALVVRRTRGMVGPNQLRVSAGAGGASFQLTVGDGTIYIKKAVTSKE